MDYAERLRESAKGGHAQFHQFVLILSKVSPDFLFFFFEGEDDPAFYNNFLVARAGEKESQGFVCGGKQEVLKAHELVARDGRAGGRAFFFIDKDHSDIVDPAFVPPPSVFQTDTYSFENYMVSEVVFGRYWVERLRLPITDGRYEQWMEKFRVAHRGYMRRCKTLMAIVLIGRGVCGDPPAKLNLNNANLGNVFRIETSATSFSIRWKLGGVAQFVTATNLNGANISVAKLKVIERRHLRGDAKRYVRGKYEAWFFVKFVQEMSRVLSDRATCAASGDQRAKPVESINENNSVALVAPLTPCPSALKNFLDEVLPIRLAA